MTRKKKSFGHFSLSHRHIVYEQITFSFVETKPKLSRKLQQALIPFLALAFIRNKENLRKVTRSDTDEKTGPIMRPRP